MVNKECTNRPRRRFQFRLGTLTLLTMLAGPILYCTYLFGPPLYYQLFPPEAQTLPSAYYLDDDIQYFPNGPDFKLRTVDDTLQAIQVSNSDDE